jgi:hypothetical protein
MLNGLIGVPNLHDDDHDSDDNDVRYPVDHGYCSPVEENGAGSGFKPLDLTTCKVVRVPASRPGIEPGLLKLLGEREGYASRARLSRHDGGYECR